MKNHDGLLKNAERNLSRRIVQCTRSDRSVCFWNRQRKRAHRLSTISKQDENWKCPFRRESQWKGYWLEDLEIVSNKRKGWVQSSSSISPTLVGSEKETFRKENRKRNPTFSRRILPQEDTSDDLGSWRVLVRQLPQEKPNIPFRFYQPLISNFAEETPMYK